MFFYESQQIPVRIIRVLTLKDVLLTYKERPVVYVIHRIVNAVREVYAHMIVRHIQITLSFVLFFKCYACIFLNLFYSIVFTCLYRRYLHSEPLHEWWNLSIARHAQFYMFMSPWFSRTYLSDM